MRGAVAKKSTLEGEWRPVYKDREGAWTLLLNKDPASKARTLAVKYTKGWEVLESLHDGTVEVLVLEGQWQVGPIVYGPGDYFCVPGGVTHPWSTTPSRLSSAPSFPAAIRTRKSLCSHAKRSTASA